MRTALAHLVVIVLTISSTRSDALGQSSFDGAFRFAENHPPLTSVIIANSREILAEKYFRGGGPHRSVNVKSASKSMLSALVGIALEKGHLESLDQPIAEFFPDYSTEFDHPYKERITVEDLLTMRTGLETTSFYNYGAWVAGRDWIRGALEKEVLAPPGRVMRYSTGSSHLISVILSRQTNMSTSTFAQRELFGPLGISGIGWDKDPLGNDFGGNNVSMTPRQMVKFGQLYLNDGMHGGKRVLPEGWVRASWRPRTTSPWNGFSYGYFWWSRYLDGVRVYYAWGHGGQRIYVVPSHDLVVVTTARLRANGRSGWDINDRIDEMLERHILPATPGQ